MSSSTSSGDKIATFTKWLHENGVANLDKLEIAEFGDMGFGVRAKQTLEAKDNNSTGICAVPKKLWIGIEDTVAIPVFKQIFSDRTIFPSMGDVDLVLAVRLMYEKLREDAPSFWAPWISMLPSKFTSTYFWTDEQLAHLDGTNLFERTKTHRAQIKQEYDTLFHKLFKKFPDTFHKRKHTLKEFEWALAAVWSHQIDVEVDGKSRRVLVPFVDMFNHASQSKLGYKVLNNADSIGVVGDETVNAGDQICVNYNKPNVVLLHLMGFAAENNPKDLVEIFLYMDPGNEMYKHKVSVLKSAGIHSPNGPYLLKTDELVRDFPIRVLGALRIQHATLSDLNRLSSAFKHDELLSIENEVQTLKALQEGLQSMLGQIKGDYKEDVAQFIGCQKPEMREKLSYEEYHALLMRLSDRKILNRALFHLGTKEAAVARFVQHLQDTVKGVDPSAPAPATAPSESQ